MYETAIGRQTERALVNAGYTPESVERALRAGGDLSLLEHEARVLVQLRKDKGNG